MDLAKAQKAKSYFNLMQKIALSGVFGPIIKF